MKGLTLIFEFVKNLFIVSILFVTYSAAVNELQFDGGNYNVTWKYLPASQEIEFEVRAKATGYVALGLTKTNSAMQNLDLFVGGVNSGNNYLKDYYATGYGAPPEDSQQDYTLLSASESNGVTMVRCKRKLNTQDANDLLIQPGDSVYIVVAYQSSLDSLFKHSYKSYSSQMHVLVPVMTASSPSPSPSSSSSPSPSPSPSSKGPTSISYNKEIAFNKGDFRVFWKFDSSTNELFFKLVVNATGWVGLGFSSAQKEIDIVVAGVAGGQGYIGDYFSTGPVTPPRDPREDYILRSATESGGTTTVEFKRKINTGDQDKDLQIVPGELYYFAWAYHSSIDRLIYHDHSQRGYSGQKVVLAAVDPTTSSTTEKPTTEGSAVTANYSLVMIILSLIYAFIVY